MFRSIRGKLAVVNSATLLIVLVALGALLYWHVQYRLYNDMDEILHQSESRVRSVSNLDELLRSDFQELQQDERTTYLFWGANGELIGQLPEQAFSPDVVQTFKPNVNKPELLTEAFNRHRYRVLELSCGNTHCRSSKPIDTITIVRSLSDVHGMLRTLQRDLAAGIAVGFVLSIAGGYYLAGRALVPIRRSWDKQQRFVADASHELRTPTTIIHAQAELLLRHPRHTIEDESANVSNIVRESKRMGKLVDDLLTLARADSRALELFRVPLQLDVIVEEVAEQFRLIAETKQVLLRADARGPIRFWGDENRIRQLLIILLDNALKFTPPSGSIDIAVHHTSHGIQLRVSDTGCGIPAEDLPHLFERFYRGDKARSRATGGTGLGLSIAEWIVKAHDGKIRIHSAPGSGTTVEINFPGSRMPKS